MDNLNTTQSSNNKKITFLLIVGICVLIAACLITVLYNREQDIVSDASKPTNSLSESLVNKQKFKDAEKALSANEDAKARDLYSNLLKEAETPNDEGQLLYRIALAETFDNPSAAIVHLKEIAANEKFSTQQRAYAIQRIGLTYLRVSKTELVAEIFSDEPYTSFYDGVDTQLAFRKLYEYCSSMYPVAMCELRAALWYTKQLQLGFDKDPKSADYAKLKNEYVPIVEQKLARADIDIEKTKLSENEGFLIPEILYVKAVNYARLSYIGYEYDYDTAMNLALNSAKVLQDPGADGQVRYAYTIALLRDNRLDDAVKIFQPLIKNFSNYDGFKGMFIRERSNNLGERANILLIAKNIPDFKKLLISLGWAESDFVTE